MNTVTVKINGVEYNLKGEEREEYLHTVASYVDKKIKNIMGKNCKLNTSSAAVLTAINVVDEMFKKTEDFTELALRAETMEKKQNEHEEQIEAFKKQVKSLEEYNKELQSKNKESCNNEDYYNKEEELIKARRDLKMMQDTAQKYMENDNEMKSKNKELKFQLQTSKYKLMDLQHKLIESQICLAKEKKQNNPLINTAQ